LEAKENGCKGAKEINDFVINYLYSLAVAANDDKVWDMLDDLSDKHIRKFITKAEEYKDDSNFAIAYNEYWDNK
jgi:hypothetical protein